MHRDDGKVGNRTQSGMKQGTMQRKLRVAEAVNIWFCPLADLNLKRASQAWCGSEAQYSRLRTEPVCALSKPLPELDQRIYLRF
jgi:hypothetical protein